MRSLSARTGAPGAPRICLIGLRKTVYAIHECHINRQAKLSLREREGKLGVKSRFESLFQFPLPHCRNEGGNERGVLAPGG